MRGRIRERPITCSFVSVDLVTVTIIVINTSKAVTRIHPNSKQMSRTPKQSVSQLGYRPAKQTKIVNICTMTEYTQ